MPRQMASARHDRLELTPVRRIAARPHQFRIAVVEKAPAFDVLAQHRPDRGEQAFRDESGDGSRLVVVAGHGCPFLRTHHRGDMAGRDQRVEAGVSAKLSSMATAGQVRRVASSSDRLGGMNSASIAATGAAVVSKPAAKNTTGRSGIGCGNAHRLQRRGDRDARQPRRRAPVPACGFRLSAR